MRKLNDGFDKMALAKIQFKFAKFKLRQNPQQMIQKKRKEKEMAQMSQRQSDINFPSEELN